MEDKSRRAILQIGTARLLTGLAGCGAVLGGGDAADNADGSPTTDGAQPVEGSATNANVTPTESTGTPRAELKERIEALEQRVETLKGKIESKSDRIESLERTVGSKDDRIASLEADLESLKSQLENKTARIEALESKIDEKDQRISELEATVDDLEGARFSDEIVAQARSVGNELERSVVYLYKELEVGSTSGTGWFIDEETIVSNGHVVTDFTSDGDTYESMTAFTSDGTSFSVEPVAENHGMVDGVHVDMAVLSSDQSGVPVETGDEEELTVDQPLVQNGHPSNVGEWVTSLGRFRGFEPFRGLTSTVPTRGGNSGSPLATLEGKVVGLTSSTYSKGPDTGKSDEPSPASDTVYSSENYGDTVETITASTSISTVEQFVSDNT